MEGDPSSKRYNKAARRFHGFFQKGDWILLMPLGTQ